METGAPGEGECNFAPHVVQTCFAQSVIQGVEPVWADHNEYHLRAAECVLDFLRKSVASVDSGRVKEQRIVVEPMPQPLEESPGMPA